MLRYTLRVVRPFLTLQKMVDLDGVSVWRCLWDVFPFIVSRHAGLFGGLPLSPDDICGYGKDSETRHSAEIRRVVTSLCGSEVRENTK